MVIAGWRKNYEILAFAGDRACMNCQHTTRHFLVGERKEVRLYFVPVARFGRKRHLVCDVCGHKSPVGDELSARIMRDTLQPDSTQPDPAVELEPASTPPGPPMRAEAEPPPSAGTGAEEWIKALEAEARAEAEARRLRRVLDEPASEVAAPDLASGTTKKEAKMATAEDALDADRQAISQGIGNSLGTYLAKWAGVRFSRFEPGWSQSVKTFAEKIFAYNLEINRLEDSIDGDAVANFVKSGQPVTGNDQKYAAAFLSQVACSNEFLEYWIAQLPRRQRVETSYEFGRDTGTLVVVLQEAAKKFAALST